MPQVAIVMPVRNSERFLVETVDSLRAQTFRDFELIAVDGGSTDRTLDILAGYKDSRIRIFEQPLEITPARNFGIARAESPWIAVQDSDDISLPHRLEAQWNALRRTPDAVLSYTDASCIGNLSAAGGRARFPQTQAFLAMRLCYQFPVVHSTLMFSREAALAAGGYTWRWAEDFGLAGRLVESGRTVAIAQKLVQFRLHPASNTHKLLAEMNAMVVDIAVDNCRRLLRLTEMDARRAYAALINRHQPGQMREWSWFLRYCVPRLKWNSAELYAWLGWQTVKSFRPAKAGNPKTAA
ncbi:MAG: glycosyltransferase [Verrucomicrobiota bacterium]